MNSISCFRIDRSLNPDQQNKILVSFIDKFLNTKRLSILINKLAKIYDIPEKVFLQDTQNMIFQNYRNPQGKFLPIYGVGKALIAFLKYLSFMDIYFVCNKEKNIEKLDIITMKLIMKIFMEI